MREQGKERQDKNAGPRKWHERRRRDTEGSGWSTSNVVGATRETFIHCQLVLGRDLVQLHRVHRWRVGTRKNSIHLQIRGKSVGDFPSQSVVSHMLQWGGARNLATPLGKKNEFPPMSSPWSKNDGTTEPAHHAMSFVCLRHESRMHECALRSPDKAREWQCYLLFPQPGEGKRTTLLTIQPDRRPERMAMARVTPRAATCTITTAQCNSKSHSGGQRTPRK